MTIEDDRICENESPAGEAPSRNAGGKADGASSGGPQTWSADHGGGVSPPTSTGSINEEQVHEPANDWPAADGHPVADPSPSPVDDFTIPESDGRRTFQNGDTDRDETVGNVD